MKLKTLLSPIVGAAVAGVLLYLVINMNSDPFAVISVNSNGTFPVSEMAHFNAKLSHDNDGEIIAWSWDFGDGSEPGQGESVLHHYQVGGDYKVTLTVTDNRGGTATTSIVVFVLYEYYYGFEDQRLGPITPTAYLFFFIFHAKIRSN